VEKQHRNLWLALSHLVPEQLPHLSRDSPGSTNPLRTNKFGVGRSVTNPSTNSEQARRINLFVLALNPSMAQSIAFWLA
jgi:hypothetical protein